MKHFYLFLFFAMIGSIGFSQIGDEAEKREIKYTAVYPGCDKEFPLRKRADMERCLQTHLKELLESKLENFGNILEDFNVKEVNCLVEFQINTNGKIDNIKTLESNNYLSKLLGVSSVDAMRQISNEVGYIKPAILDNGKQGRIKLILPVTFRVDYLDKPISASKFNFSEIVIVTLKSDHQIYEVRQEDKTAKIKIYDISKKNAVLVDQFDSLLDAFQKDPYKSLYLAGGKKHLITERREEGVLYRLYTNDSNPDQVYLYSVSGKTEKLEGSYNKSYFAWRRYSGWVLR